MRLFPFLIAISVSACSRSDFDLNYGRTDIIVTQKGCATDRSGRRDLFINMQTERLPDGRIQCTITTVVTPTQ